MTIPADGQRSPAPLRRQPFRPAAPRCNGCQASAAIEIPERDASRLSAEKPARRAARGDIGASGDLRSDMSAIPCHSIQRESRFVPGRASRSVPIVPIVAVVPGRNMRWAPASTSDSPESMRQRASVTRRFPRRARSSSAGDSTLKADARSHASRISSRTCHARKDDPRSPARRCAASGRFPAETMSETTAEAAKTRRCQDLNWLHRVAIVCGSEPNAESMLR